MDVITVKSELLNEEYKKVTHKSGLDIYVFPKELATTYAIISTRFGSTDNTFRIEGESEFTTVPDGVAHFLEHKMFENEDGEDTFVKFSRTGADANAFTSFRNTAYLFSCVDEVYSSLEILLTSVFSPYFTEENVKKEQGIIAQEIKMGEDNPTNRVLYGMLEGLYEKNSVRIDIAGTVPSIMEITPDILYRCHKAFYNPANMALCVCGNAELQKVIEVADKVLMDVKPIRVETLKAEESKNAFLPRIEQRMQVAKPIICIGIKDTDIPSDPEEISKRDIAIQMISNICFGKSSEFFAQLYRDGLISSSLGCWNIQNEAFSFLSIETDTSDPDELYCRFKDYAENKLIASIDEESFERCRRVIYSDFIKDFDSTEEIATILINDFALEKTEIFRFADHIKNMSINYVKNVASELFKPEKYTMSVVLPIETTEEE